MFESFSRSWNLVKASYGVLKQDKELLWFPVMSTIGLIIVTIVMMLPLAGTGVFQAVEAGEELSNAQAVTGLIMAFLFYFVTYTVIIFSNTALIGAAMIRLDGGDPTVQDGLRIASERLPVILGWAAIAATVGMILQALQSAARDSENPVTQILGSILVGLAGFAWNLITFLVIPVFVVEKVGPIQAIKRSTSLLKGTWGENITGSFSVGLIQFLVMLAVFLIVGLPLILIASAANSGILMAGAIGVLVVIVGAIGLFFSALNGIFQAALYKYATGEEGRVGEFFDREMVANAFQPKGA